MNRKNLQEPGLNRTSPMPFRHTVRSATRVAGHSRTASGEAGSETCRRTSETASRLVTRIVVA